MKTKAVTGLILALVLSLSAAGVAARSASAPRAKTADVTTLIPRALEIVRSKSEFAKANLLEADGLPAGREAVKTADEIVRWQFVFDNASPKHPSVTLNYSKRRGFAAPVGNAYPALEDIEIKTAPTMTLARAVTLLENAGYRRGFYNVVLRNPVGPKATPPFYIFGVVGGKYIAVNTKTGKVVAFR